MIEQKPDRMPPNDETAGANLAMTVPDEAMLKAAMEVEDATTTPIMPDPPPETEGVGEQAATGTWHNGKKITALWSNNQNRNVFIAVDTVGWRKLADNSDSAVVAMNMIAAHAKQTGRPAYSLEENSKVAAIYVW